MVMPAMQDVCSMATVNEVVLFTVNRMVGGYCEYCNVWDTVLGERIL